MASENLTQAEHDARHPGLTCKTCPRTIERQQAADDFARSLRRSWWRRWF